MQTLGRTYFLKALYLLHPWKNGEQDKSKIEGYAISVMSAVQQSEVVVYVQNDKATSLAVEVLNDAGYFMTEINLVNGFVNLGKNGKYRITCTDFERVDQEVQ